VHVILFGEEGSGCLVRRQCYVGYIKGRGDEYSWRAARNRSSWSEGVFCSGMYANKLDRVNVKPSFRGEKGDAKVSMAIKIDKSISRCMLRMKAEG
jgi:hypothetical protein